MTTTEKPGCGAQARKIIYRGKTRRLFLCDDCPYEGSGKVVPYAEAREGVTPAPGTHTGAARKCGETVE